MQSMLSTESLWYLRRTTSDSDGATGAWGEITAPLSGDTTLMFDSLQSLKALDSNASGKCSCDRYNLKVPVKAA